MQVGDAVIADGFQRNPLTATSTNMFGVLQLSVTNVTSAVANDLEYTFDTGTDLDHGTVTWIAGAGSVGVLTFSIPVRGC